MLLKEVVWISQMRPVSLYQRHISGVNQQDQVSEVQQAGEVDQEVYVYCMEMSCWELGKFNLILVAKGRRFFPTTQQLPARLMEQQLSEMALDR